MTSSRSAGSQIAPAPIAAWLLVQLGALLIATFRVPLAAQYPQPAEFHAVQMMLAAQFSLLALTFPWLLQTWRQALSVLAAGSAMLLAASALAAWGAGEILPACLFLAAWVLVFTTLGLIRSPRAKLLTLAVAATYVLGGPLLWYLRLEFSAAGSLGGIPGFGPLLQVVSTPHHLPPLVWFQVSAAEIIAIGAWIFDQKTRQECAKCSVASSQEGISF